MQYNSTDISLNRTIVAIATPSGSGAIALIRLSGPQSVAVAAKIFQGKNLMEAESHRSYFGKIVIEGQVIDEVLLTLFKSPHSYTGEDVVEISCHGSLYIQQRILESLIKHGAGMAEPGEYTFRAFMNRKLDLMQAEAVADLIASTSKTSHQLALEQMRGGYSTTIKTLRQQLVDFASLIELELDFGEEDVEFADRSKLLDLLNSLDEEIQRLIESFKLGNVIKQGIPVAIIGKPNVGKSTLLNAILNEEKAIVSEIPGTTRDVIEDVISIKGFSFRFIDTAGLRDSDDEIESIGIERTREKITQASIILYVFDITETTLDEVREVIDEYRALIEKENKKLILIANKIDNLAELPQGFKDYVDQDTIFISAKRKENIQEISDCLMKAVDREGIKDQTIVSNLRHYEAFLRVADDIEKIKQALEQNIPSDLMTIDIRDALYYLGQVTGEVTTDEILGNIFGRFCIGK